MPTAAEVALLVQRYLKAIVGFISPGAIIVGASVLENSDGGSAITQSEWVTAVVAAIVTAGGVGYARNKK